MIGLGNRCTAVCHQNSFDSFSLLLFKALAIVKLKTTKNDYIYFLSFLIFCNENVPVKIKLVVDQVKVIHKLDYVLGSEKDQNKHDLAADDII